MKQNNLIKLFSISAMVAAVLLSCKPEGGVRQDVADPVIEITSTDLEGLPGESINLSAKVTDDLGIDYILVESIDWEFSKRIDFSHQNYITEYNLTEAVIIPAEAPRGSFGEVTIKCFDFSEKLCSKSTTISVIAEPARLSIVQEMGFNIVLAGKVAKVENNNVQFVEPEGGTRLPVKMVLTSNNTKLKTLTVKSVDFGIDETVDLTSISTDEGMKAVIDKNFRISAQDEEKHLITFTLTDEKGNTAEYAPTVAVKSTFEGWNQKHDALFFYDSNIDYSKAVFGLPALAQRKTQESDKFTVTCFSEKAGTEIYFVNTRDTESQVKYGISNDGKYFIKSDNPKPIILEEAGYYEISINLLEGTYEVKKLGKQESRFGEMYFVHAWSEYPAMSQTDAENYPSRWAIDYNLGNGGVDVAFGIGGGVWLVAAGSDSQHPEVWLHKDDKGKFPEYGGNFFDTNLPGTTFGNCQIIFDNFLMKAYALKKE